MANITETLPNLMNGVSQQAVTMRLTSQAEAQRNGYSSVVEGVNKRPPSKHIAKIIDGLPGDAYVYTINRDINERYVVVVTNGAIRVFELDGTERTVTYPDGTSYITEAMPSEAFRAMTLGDYTFLVNRNKTVATLPTVTAARPRKTILFIKGVNYGTVYTVKLDGTNAAQYTVGAASSGAQLRTTVVANNLLADLQSNGALSDYSFELYESYIVITQNSGADGSWAFSDSFADTYTEVVADHMEIFADLPTVAPHGFEVEITGSADTAADSYFLRFETDTGSGIGEGNWVETLAPGIEYKLDPATMPHNLVRQPDGSFTLEQAPWGDRLVGDLDSSPWPSFVGRTISDAYYDRNRLCFLSGDAVAMSRSRALFEFFRTTVTTLLDDGPIDITAPGTRTPTLRSAIPYNEEVIIFGDQTQFTIDNERLLASSPPEMRVLTDYQTDANTVPVAVGKTLYFTVTRGQWTSVMEYFVLEDTDTEDATEVTKHVPNYIPSGAFKLTASPTSNVVLALSANAPNEVYVYKYLWRGNEKLQSSWNYWDFDPAATILNVEFIKDIAYFVVQYPDGVYLQSIDVSDGQSDTDSEFVYRIDRRVSEQDVTWSYDVATNRSTVTLPYVPTGAVVAAVRPGANNPKTPASLLTVADVTGDQVQIVGDLTDVAFYVGETYTFEYEFSQPVLKTNSSGGSVATITGGRLQILAWLLSYQNTGYFRVEVSQRNRPPYTYVHTGTVLGTSQATLGVPSISDGVFRFGVKAKSDRVSIKIVNDSFLPSYFTAAEWEGRYSRRTSR